MIASVTALRMQVVDNGWNCVPSSSRDKRCSVLGWPTIETNEFHLENWALTHSAHTNTALVCNRDYFAVDIDVLSDPALGHRVQALAFEHLGHTDFIRVGRAPKRLLVYRQRAPYRPETRAFEGTIRSVAYKAATGDGDGIEILSGGKQFTAYGIHADTGRPYQWVGECNPLDDTPSHAPLVTQDQVDTFITAVCEIMPLGAPSGAGKANDTARVVDGDGKVTDGRESLLRDCIWQAAISFKASATPLSPDGIADIGWKAFSGQAYLGDGKYS